MASIPNLKITKRGGAVGRFGDNLPVEKNTMKLKLCPLIWSKVFWDTVHTGYSARGGTTKKLAL